MVFCLALYFLMNHFVDKISIALYGHIQKGICNLIILQFLLQTSPFTILQWLPRHISFNSVSLIMLLYESVSHFWPLKFNQLKLFKLLLGSQLGYMWNSIVNGNTNFLRSSAVFLKNNRYYQNFLKKVAMGIVEPIPTIPPKLLNVSRRALLLYL